jgi:N-acetylmuramoyl-L-alanine amidase
MSYLDQSYFDDPLKAAALSDPTQLSPDQLLTTRAMNPNWAATLGPAWLGAAISPQHYQDPASDAFAEDVRAWQATNTGFEPDGVLDDIVNLSCQNQACYAPVVQNYLILDGQPEAVPFPCVPLDAPGNLALAKGFYNHPTKPDLWVDHWDGATSSRQCRNILTARGLAVPFMLDADGTIYQGTDPLRTCAWHAGHVNPRALGVEICNPVLPARQKWCDPPRPIIKMRVRNDTHDILGFYPIQLQRLVQLIDWACTRFNIVRALPAYRGQLARVLPGAPLWQKVANSYFPPNGGGWNAGDFKGIINHYHQDDSRCDAGMEDIIPYLLQHLPGCEVHEVA